MLGSHPCTILQPAAALHSSCAESPLLLTSLSFELDQSEVEVPLSEDKVFVQGLDTRGRSLVIIKVGLRHTWKHM